VIRTVYLLFPVALPGFVASGVGSSFAGVGSPFAGVGFLPPATLLFCGFSGSGVGLDLVRFWLIWFRWVVGGAAGLFLVSGVDLSQRRR
jgi:hypothetical protein